MARLARLTIMAAICTATAAQAGEYRAPYSHSPAGYGPGPGSVVVLEGYPGAVDPMTRGALYNTPPTAIFVSGYHRRGHHRHHRVILHARS